MKGHILIMIFGICILIGMFVFVVFHGRTTQTVDAPTVTQEVLPHTDTSTQQAIGKIFSDYGLSIEKVVGTPSWSPDNRYILFQGNMKSEGEQYEVGTAIVLLDLKEQTYTEIYQGVLVGTPSWSKDYVAFGADGIYLYSLKTKQLEVVSQGGESPQISPDQSVIIYGDVGIRMYFIQEKTTETLTKNPLEIPGPWFSDGKRFTYLRNAGVKLTDGAGYTQAVSVYSLTEKTYKDISVLAQKRYRNLEWITIDKTLLVKAGFDDGLQLYTVNVESEEAYTIYDGDNSSETTVAIDPKGIIMLAQDRKIQLYDEHMKEIASYVVTGEEAYSNHIFMPDQSILVLGKNDTSESVVHVVWRKNIQKKIVSNIQNIGDILLLSPDGKAVLLAPEGKQFLMKTL